MKIKDKLMFTRRLGISAACGIAIALPGLGQAADTSNLSSPRAAPLVVAESSDSGAVTPDAVKSATSTSVDPSSTQDVVKVGDKLKEKGEKVDADHGDSSASKDDSAEDSAEHKNASSDDKKSQMVKSEDAEGSKSLDKPSTDKPDVVEKVEKSDAADRAEVEHPDKVDKVDVERPDKVEQVQVERPDKVEKLQD